VTFAYRVGFHRSAGGGQTDTDFCRRVWTLPGTGRTAGILSFDVCQSSTVVDAQIIRRGVN